MSFERPNNGDEFDDAQKWEDTSSTQNTPEQEQQATSDEAPAAIESDEDKDQTTEPSTSVPVVAGRVAVEAASGPPLESDRRDIDLLAQAAMAGSERATAELMAIINPMIVRYVRTRAYGPDHRGVSGEDIAQEIMISVLSSMDDFRWKGKPFMAYVYGIASHKIIDNHRANQRNRSEPVSELPETTDGVSPEDEALLQSLSGQLRNLLEQIPEKQAEVIRLRIIVGLSSEETAQAIGSTPGAVRVAQHRGLNALRRLVEKHHPELGNG